MGFYLQHARSGTSWGEHPSSIRQKAERTAKLARACRALHGIPDHYKIKLRRAGCRLVYRVNDETVTVLVVALGKGEQNQIHDAAKTR
ncbi:type II toxin-antitoxin system RelE/ParE family toxin [Phyllobacterium endophyticum]|uniref:type II toxin-antitoxin system RelE/ParE family toxin n=1 Tax=Phyllobacterium endophyticum TaxID=1149773 RepID=UPI003CCE72B1